MSREWWTTGSAGLVMEVRALAQTIREFACAVNEAVEAELDLRRLHASALICLLRAGILRVGLSSVYDPLLAELGKSLPGPTQRRLLSPTIPRPVEVALDLLQKIREFLASARIDKESDLDYLTKNISAGIKGKIGAVFVADCLSLPEFVTMMVEASRRGLYVTLLDSIFVNPAGKTAFVKEQAPEPHYLRSYAEKLSSLLGAKHCSGVSFDIDKHLHSDEGFALLDFARNHPLADVWMKALRLKASFGSLLITTDHGYDILEGSGSLYVLHGSRREGVLSLSRLAPFLVVW